MSDPDLPFAAPLTRTRWGRVAARVTVAGALAATVAAGALATMPSASASEDPSTFVVGKGVSALLNDVHFTTDGKKASYTEIACDDATDGRAASEAVLITTPSGGEYAMPYHRDTRGIDTCDGLDRSAVNTHTIAKVRIKVCQDLKGVRSHCVKSPYIVNPYAKKAVPTPVATAAR